MKERINKYEKILDDVTIILNNLENNISLLEDKIKDLKDLDNYYQSSEWLKDFDYVMKMKIKSGVLSEDLVWNLFERISDLEQRIYEINFNVNKTQL